MMFKYKIDIHEIKKLTKGEGYKVKDQGQLCIFENLFSTIYHEVMIQYEQPLHIWLILDN